MQNNSSEVVSTTGTAREETIWEIASWMEQNLKEDQFAGKDVVFTELWKPAEKILVEHRNNPHLQKLLAELGGNDEDQLAGTHDALEHVARAFCRHSSVYPHDWLEQYKGDVTTKKAVFA
jgi:hypothetical protein